MSHQLAYRRILLKLSGEALGRAGIEPAKLSLVVNELRALRRRGCELALVIGGGNIWRKREQGKGMDEVAADYLGMLATVMNALALRQSLKRAGLRVRVQSYLATDTPGIEPVNSSRASAALRKGEIVIFASGTGKPFVTTDTAAVRQAVAIRADAIIKAGPADGVYTADPEKVKRAKKFTTITIREALRRKLGFMDSSALKLCARAKVPIIVCRWGKGTLLKVVLGARVGTVVTV